jgi:outer membrane biosynthesis protein TonB
MGARGERIRAFLRANRASVALGVVLVALLGLAVRWIATNRSSGLPPRKVMQFTVVNVQPQAPKAPPPTPPPQSPVKELDEPAPERVRLDPVELPPDAPPPGAAPPAGPLALAAAGEGPGDAFNLAGNPGGRGLLSGGGLGDGSGDGLGQGGVETRYAWYYARMQPDIDAALRKRKRLANASIVAELRIWWDGSGRISRVQAVRPSADPAIDEELGSLVGVQLRHPPPADVPMPVVMVVRARRPQ